MTTGGPGLTRRIEENPFYVLGLRPDCARTEVEREGSRLLSMLALGLTEAKTYRSPLGVHARTEALVRTAMAELREPRRRLLHELLAALPVTEAPPPPASAPGPAKPAAVPWPRAQKVFGYGPGEEP